MTLFMSIYFSYGRVHVDLVLGTINRTFKLEKEMITRKKRKQIVIIPLSEACSIAAPYKEGMSEVELTNLLTKHITTHILNSDKSERFLDEKQKLMSVETSVRRFLIYYMEKYKESYCRFWEIVEFGNYFSANNDDGSRYFETLFKKVAHDLGWWKCIPLNR